MTPEGIIKRQVRDFLRLRGWFIFHVQQGPLCHPGVSDLICIKDGLVIFAEIKTPKGQLSHHQERFRDNVQEKGAHFFVLRSLEDAISMEQTIARRAAP